MQNLRTLFRPIIGVPALFLFVVVAGTCVAQSAPQRPAPAVPHTSVPSQPESAAAPVPDAEEGTDSPDIPPFALNNSAAHSPVLRNQLLGRRGQPQRNVQIKGGLRQSSG